MKILISLLAPLLLTGCIFGSGNARVDIYQESLLVKCPMLSEVEDGTGAAISTAWIDHIRQHNRCAIRHNGLVDAIRENQ